jgi:hypothetical protein
MRIKPMKNQVLQALYNRRREANLSKRKDVLTNANGLPLLDPYGPAQHGLVKDSATGQVGQYALVDGVADRNIHEMANEMAEKERQRMWTVSAVFAYGHDNGEPTDRKHVGVFVLSPKVPTAEKSSEIIQLPFEEQREATKEIRTRSENVRSANYYIIESARGTCNLPEINRQSLYQLLMGTWRRYPVNTLGHIELNWPDGRVWVKIGRDQLLTTTGQDEMFSHLRRILELMSLGFKVDPTIIVPGRGNMMRRVGAVVKPWQR